MDEEYEKMQSRDSGINFLFSEGIFRGWLDWPTNKIKILLNVAGVQSTIIVTDEQEKELVAGLKEHFSYKLENLNRLLGKE